MCKVIRYLAIDFPLIPVYNNYVQIRTYILYVHSINCTILFFNSYITMSTQSFTRKQYLDGMCTHEQYYAQFVDESVEKAVLSVFGLDLLKSKDQHLNDLDLYLWDSITLPAHIVEKLKAHDDFYSKAGAVCICKQAARGLLAIL